MCNRITQFRTGSEYMAALGWETGGRDSANGGPRYNVAPGASSHILHRLPAGQRAIARLRWGCELPRTRGRPDVVATLSAVDSLDCARIALMWRQGRCVVPADGWFEWRDDAASPVAYRIRLPNDAPMFFAALTDLHLPRARGVPPGFIIVTAHAGYGLVELADRRPVVLAQEDALLWLDPKTPLEMARHIVSELLLPPPAFEWYVVSPMVRDAGYDSPELLVPLEEPA